VLAFLFVFGIGVLAGAAVAVVSQAALRHPLLAGLAGCASTAAWLLFAFDWMLYAVGENGPAYYSFSTYVEYRRAVEGLGGVAIGLGYALLAGAVVVGATVLSRRAGRGWAVATAPIVVGAVALPALVPGVLPRVEHGRDPVLHLSHGPYKDPGTGMTTVCFHYGVERLGAGPDAVGNDPELCVRRRHRMNAYELSEELNDSGIRPRDKVPGGSWR
jgi:hypothetical protein